MKYDGNKPKPRTAKPPVTPKGRPGRTQKYNIEVKYNMGLKIGDKVAYIKTDGSYENGMIKSFGDGNYVFVVYNCAGEWDDYQNYTAAQTDTGQIVRGWRK